MLEHYRTCPLCEATCGLTITTRGTEVVSVRGDDEDVFSHGFICPKGVALKELHDDPDRLRTPMIRQPDGTHRPASWDDAFALINEKLPPLIAADRNSVAVYLGNPSVHNLSTQLYPRALLKLLGTQNIFSASSLDQMPKQVSCALMFGHALTVPIPDIDRTDYLLMLGANPLASNGSLMTAPDYRGRLRALVKRGGRLVVVDPRRSRTAEIADEHVFVRPGTDAYLLFAMVNVLFAEGLTKPGRLADFTDGIDEVQRLAAQFTPQAVAGVTGVPAATITRLARELAAAERAAVYARIGTCTQEFGTLASWLVDVLNIVTGNLDRAGGATFPLAAAGQFNSSGLPGSGRGVRFGRWASRVRGMPELFAELPASCLAEEIETPGEGQVKALITFAGNPALSAPNGDRLARALDELEFMVSFDVYLNETTRHADVILPGPSALNRSHYDFAFYQLAVRNIANYSAPVFAESPDLPDEWQSILRLVGIVTGQGPDGDIAMMDDLVVGELIRKEIGIKGSPIFGQDQAQIVTSLAPRRGPDRILDFLLRVGPYGDGFGARPDGITLATLEANPHGLDLGPHTSRLPDALRTANNRIDLAPALITGDVSRLAAGLAVASSTGQPNGHSNGMVLVGRRDLRSNNSWMHNVPLLVKGPDRCTVHVHPSDASRLGLVDGKTARVASAAGVIEVPVEVTDAIMPGVVSIPHGWGHCVNGTQQGVAAAHPGANSNVLADDSKTDAISGNAVLNGIPVTLAPA